MNKRVDIVVSELNQILLGKEQQVRLALWGLLARGHLLIEDIPGMGKTTLGHLLAEPAGPTGSAGAPRTTEERTKKNDPRNEGE